MQIQCYTCKEKVLFSFSLISSSCCLDGICSDVISHLEPYGQGKLSRDEREQDRRILVLDTAILAQDCLHWGCNTVAGVEESLGLCDICAYILTSARSDLQKECIKKSMSDTHAFCSEMIELLSVIFSMTRKNMNARELEATRGNFFLEKSMWVLILRAWWAWSWFRPSSRTGRSMSIWNRGRWVARANKSSWRTNTNICFDCDYRQ